jgi:WD40 repeat protein
MTVNVIICIVSGNKGWVTGLEYKPSQSDLFISTGMDYNIKLWDIRCGSSTLTVKGKLFVGGDMKIFVAPEGIHCHSVSWSPFSNNLISSADEAGCVYFYDIRRVNESLLVQKIHDNSIHRISFSPCVKGLVATVSDDSAVKMFHYPSNKTMYNIFSVFVIIVLVHL